MNFEVQLVKKNLLVYSEYWIRFSNRGDDKVQQLRSLRAEDEISLHITGTVKDGPLLERLAWKQRRCPKPLLLPGHRHASKITHWGSAVRSSVTAGRPHGSVVGSLCNTGYCSLTFFSMWQGLIFTFCSFFPLLELHSSQKYSYLKLW